MKVLTLIALVLSVALTGSTSAQPRDEHGGRVPYRGQHVRPQPPPPPPHRTGDWVSLATPTPTSVGTEWIPVGRHAGAFRSLRIDALAGTVNVRSVRVEYSNGRVDVFYLARQLNRRHPTAYVEFRGPRWIERIAITTARRPAGTYAVYGSWAPAPAHDIVAAR